MCSPVEVHDRLQRLEWTAKPVILERRLDDERHPRLCEHVRARHVVRGRDREEDRREVRDKLVEERPAARRELRGEVRARGRGTAGSGGRAVWVIVLEIGVCCETVV